MDEFLDWIMECYREGELSEEDIDLAIGDDNFAYRLFIESWSCDKSGTSSAAQEIFKKVKERIKMMAVHGKSHT